MSRFSCCLEQSFCVIHCACLTLQWKDTDSSLFCDCRSGFNHIFQVQLIAALRTSLLNKAMFIQPTCTILPFLVKTSSNNHIIDMMLGKRIIWCVNYTKKQKWPYKMYRNVLGWNATHAHPFDPECQQHKQATEKYIDSKVKIKCATFVIRKRHRLHCVWKRMKAIAIVNKFTWWFHAGRAWKVFIQSHNHTKLIKTFTFFGVKSWNDWKVL